MSRAVASGGFDVLAAVFTLAWGCFARIFHRPVALFFINNSMGWLVWSRGYPQFLSYDCHISVVSVT